MSKALGEIDGERARYGWELASRGKSVAAEMVTDRTDVCWARRWCDLSDGIALWSRLGSSWALRLAACSMMPVREHGDKGHGGAGYGSSDARGVT